ncbi:MAG: hypothetical protein QXP36_10710 [Conexivisphaerales archaeon]
MISESEKMENAEIQAGNTAVISPKTKKQKQVIDEMYNITIDQLKNQLENSRKILNNAPVKSDDILSNLNIYYSSLKLHIMNIQDILKTINNNNKITKKHKKQLIKEIISITNALTELYLSLYIFCQNPPYISMEMCQKNGNGTRHIIESLDKKVDKLLNLII